MCLPILCPNVRMCGYMWVCVGVCECVCVWLCALLNSAAFFVSLSLYKPLAPKCFGAGCYYYYYYY